VHGVEDPLVDDEAAHEQDRGRALGRGGGVEPVHEGRDHEDPARIDTCLFELGRHVAGKDDDAKRLQRLEPPRRQLVDLFEVCRVGEAGRAGRPIERKAARLPSEGPFSPSRAEEPVVLDRDDPADPRCPFEDLRVHDIVEVDDVRADFHEHRVEKDRGSPARVETRQDADGTRGARASIGSAG